MKTPPTSPRHHHMPHVAGVASLRTRGFAVEVALFALLLVAGVLLSGDSLLSTVAFAAAGVVFLRASHNFLDRRSAR